MSLFRWLLPSYRSVYAPLFSATPSTVASFDAFDALPRLTAHQEMARGFRSWQASLNLTHNPIGEGGLELFPSMCNGTAYVMLRPFFQPVAPKAGDGSDALAAYLDKVSSSQIPD